MAKLPRQASGSGSSSGSEQEEEEEEEADEEGVPLEEFLCALNPIHA